MASAAPLAATTLPSPPGAFQTWAMASNSGESGYCRRIFHFP
jgi:hypothetical protein